MDEAEIELPKWAEILLDLQREVREEGEKSRDGDGDEGQVSL